VRRSWLAMGLAVIVSAAAASEGSGASARERDADDAASAREAVARQDADRVRRRAGTLRVRWASPQQVGLAVGALWVQQPRDYDCATVCDYAGLQVQVEGSTGGVQVAAGYANLVGETGRNRRYLSRVFTGFGVRGVVLRTFGNARLEPRRQTFAGLELAYTVTRISMTLGLARRISSAPEADRWRVVGGLGWGY